MQTLPTKSKLLSNFLSCTNWEEKYMYIIDLGKLLSKFPKNMRTKEFLISGCQSQTWIALTIPLINPKNIHIFYTYSTKLYGDSDSSIVKGIISIIFSVYQGLNLQKIIDLNITPFLEQLELNQNLTISRSQGIQEILKSIKVQAQNLQKNL